MKKLKRFYGYTRSSGQAGQALILVLIFLMLGSLTLVPTLSHISTALKTGEIYEENTNELYTSDAGVEDALWRIKYDFMGVDYNPYDFETAFPYQTEDVNGMMADFTISNVWFPSDVTFTDPYAPGFIDMTPGEVLEMIESEKLVVEGSALPGNPYSVLIDFNPDAGDYLTIKSLGVWLPQGFTYVPNSCSLQAGGQFTDYNPDDITVAEAPGGTTVLWSYDPDYPYLDDFPNYDSESFYFVFTFSYNAPPDHPTWLPAAIAWVTTEMHDQFGSPKYPLNSPENVPASWDIDTRYFKIVSQTGDTTIEAYTSKNELRQMGDAMSGDYVAIGNALLKDDDGDWRRDDWHTPSSFTLDSIPADADAVYAFLYWTGWRNNSDISTIFSETCSDFDEWDRSTVAGSQTRVPTGDYDGSGFTGSPYWSKVDETTPNDGDYITGQDNSGGNRLFNFSDFTVPAGSEIVSLKVYFRAMDASSPDTNNLRARIRVDGNNYNGSSVDPGAEWTTYSYTWDENPDTGDPWTWEDINGDSSDPLERFGVYGNDFNPDIRVSMVYAEVTYSESLWTISSGEFRGQGSSQVDPDPRTLTLKNSQNLTSPGIYNISWDQDESGSLSSGDTLYYAFSGDGGDNWSSYYKAFSDDDPDSPFTLSIPDDYLTDDFKVRFYFNFNSSSEYVYLDDIEITYMPIDTEIIFKIDNQQVYFDGSEPAAGPNPLVADRYYAMRNYLSGNPHGYSYACVRDVSALVKKYPEDPGEEHHTGNAIYTVDGVEADTSNGGSLSEIAFAGWSLIVVYASPASAGHYIYIRDENFYSHTSGDENALDFDADGLPGGLITGFKIPDPITDKYGQITETVAAKLTCFIVEGDSWYTSDYLEITGQRSGLSKNLSNSGSPANNVWNNASYPGNYQGQDIDTFEVYWNDGILTPGDNNLQVDMYSETDAWNLVYFIISIRSETVTRGTTHYTIHGG